MSIKYAILGLLSWRPMTGYDLKKMFAGSVALHWSGNNNQIYTTLVDLHKDGMVTMELEHRENSPSRKIYSITGGGLSDLKKWLLGEPELPQLRHPFLVQLAWADLLEKDELDRVLGQYEHELNMRLMLYRGQKQRMKDHPARTERERFLWDMILENWVSFYESELNWLHRLQEGLS